MENKNLMIEINEAKASVMANYPNDPLLKHIITEALDKLPKVDAAPVVHGRWIFGTANHREYMKCSVCLKSQTPTGVFAYCPNCGAKMDGDGND